MLNTSVFLFRVGANLIMDSFSWRHNWQVPPLVKGSSFFNTSQLMVWLIFLSFNCQMCSLKVVAVRLCGSLNDDVCWLYRVLNWFSVKPTYVFSIAVCVCVTVAL